jgi:hypothetical protein
MMERPPESVHFNMLLELQPGTSVTYNHQEGKIFKGILQPPEKLHGQQWVKVQTSSKAGGALTHFINEERAFQVYPASHSGKLPKRQDGKDKKFLNEFVNSLLRGCDLVEFDTQSKFVCAIVGKRSLLEQEIRQTTLATYIGGGRWAEGSLQDVLKIDRFTTGSQTHRSALIPTGVNQPPGDIMSNIAISIVFDGAVGFLKWGHLWPNRHQIIILDRAEPYLYDAINAINSNFLQNRVNIACCDQYGEATPPPGTELLVFREGIL